MTADAASAPATLEEQAVHLLQSGATNTAVGAAVYLGRTAVAAIRHRHGIPPVPPAEYPRPEHPKAKQIRLLLAEGWNNTRIREKTGADVKTIARMRAECGVGAPTIPGRKPERRHPRYDEICALLAKLSNSAIARELGVDSAAVARVRKDTGIVCRRTQRWMTVEEKWLDHVRPVEGGHLEWTGERAATSGTPVMRFREVSFSPAAIAFRWATGRDAVGNTFAECGHHQCVAPDHVDDEPGRAAVREQVRYLLGGAARPTHCRHGHDQAVDGRYEADGTAYCEACKREIRRGAR